MRYFKCLLITLLVFTSCKNERKPVRGPVAEKAMVVSAREEASKIGSAILEKGGNAFDAMVATELALAVAFPCAGNIGGGGFMVYRMANGDIGSLDYREKAPKAATKDMYLDSLGNIIPNKSLRGAMAVGVPGTVAGMFAVYNKFGSLPIESIIQPVIDLAEKGFIVTKKQEARIKSKQQDFREINADSILYLNYFKENDTIKQTTLAKTLTEIMRNGSDGFYKGNMAKILVDFIQDNGGIITEDDMAAYEAKWRTPITFNYDNLKIISIGPPSSGGICLSQIMTMLEPFPLDEFGHNSLKSIQVITEAERRSYADRNFYLGDPDFVNIPTEELISTMYLKDRMSSFSFEKATKSSELSHGNVQIIESNETTHYSIIDPF